MCGGDDISEETGGKDDYFGLKVIAIVVCGVIMEIFSPKNNSLQFILGGLVLYFAFKGIFFGLMINRLKLKLKSPIAKEWKELLISFLLSVLFAIFYFGNLHLL